MMWEDNTNNNDYNNTEESDSDQHSYLNFDFVSSISKHKVPLIIPLFPTFFFFFPSLCNIRLIFICSCGFLNLIFCYTKKKKKKKKKKRGMWLWFGYAGLLQDIRSGLWCFRRCHSIQLHSPRPGLLTFIHFLFFFF